MDEKKILQILEDAKLSKECLKHLEKKFQLIEQELKIQALHANGEYELKQIQAFYKAMERLKSMLNMDIQKANGVKNA